MTDHLCPWSLDRLAAGLAIDADRRQHLATCAACRRRFTEHAESTDAIRRHPRFATTRARVLAAAPERQPGARPMWFAGLALAAAATIAALALSPEPQPTTRTKGSASLALVAIDDGSLHTRWSVDDEVELRVDSRRPFVLVLAVDAIGEVSVAWPAADFSGPMPADGRLSPGFRVTPGDLTLLAVFSDRPLAAADARAVLARVAEDCAEPLDRDCLDAMPRAGSERAWYRLNVDEGGTR